MNSVGTRQKSDIALVLLILFCGFTRCLAVTTVGASQYAQDHLLIKFKSGVAEELPPSFDTNMLPLLVTRLGLPESVRLREPMVNSLLREQGATSAGITASGPVNFERFLYLDLPEDLTVEQCLQFLQGNPLLEYAEPDFIGTGGATIPNDPSFGSQWHHKNNAKPSACIHTPDAWDITQGNTNVIVAVLDTGLGNGLAEFSGRTVPGYNFAYSTSDTSDDYGHGT